MKEPRVAVITINYHKEEKTVDFIESVKKQNYKNYSITVVDNESEPDAFQNIKYKNMIVRNPENSGWAGGFRLAVEFILHKEKPDYFLLSNNDIVVDKDMLKELVKTAETDEKIGYVAPTIFRLRDRSKIWTRGGYLNYWTGVGKETGRKNDDEVQEVKGPNEYMDDCVCLVKREVLEQAGFHDPIYFLYFEEIDWNIAVRKAGFKIMHNPIAKCYHEIHGSSEGEKSPTVVYYLTRNRMLFMRKHRPLRLPIFLLLYTFAVLPAQIIKYSFKRKFNLLKPLIKGYFKGILLNIGFPKFSNPKL